MTGRELRRQWLEHGGTDGEAWDRLAAEVVPVSEVVCLRVENTRLRELYENVTGNRERFGFTINHLLECEEALRVAEEEQPREIVEWLRERAKHQERPIGGPSVNAWSRIADAIEARFAPGTGDTAR